MLRKVDNSHYWDTLESLVNSLTLIKNEDPTIEYIKIGVENTIKHGFNLIKGENQMTSIYGKCPICGQANMSGHACTTGGGMYIPTEIRYNQIKYQKRQCCKCGSEDIVLTYVGKDDYYFHRSERDAGLNIKEKSDKEFMLCHCKTCHYEWNEDTLDNLHISVTEYGNTKVYPPDTNIFDKNGDRKS